MNLLLSANFMRLWKSKVFWVSIAVMAGIGVFEVTAGYISAKELGMGVSLDKRYFSFALGISVVLSAFCPLFVGAEYSDGTIRNKIMAGHSRTAIYLANFLTCAAAGIFLCFGYILPVLAEGIPLLGWFQLELKAILWFTLCVFIMTVAMAALFTLISMLNQNKAVVAIICIFLAYFLLFLGIYLNSRLAEPEVIPAQEYIEDGKILLREAYPNPGYIQGIKRVVYAFLYALPGCQAVQLAVTAEACPSVLPLASGLVAAGVTVAGAALFRRKDLK